MGSVFARVLLKSGDDLWVQEEKLSTSDQVWKRPFSSRLAAKHMHLCVCVNEEVGGELRGSELSNFLPAHLFPMMKCFELIAF